MRLQLVLEATFFILSTIYVLSHQRRHASDIQCLLREGLPPWESLRKLKELSFLASEFKKIILAANQKRYLIVFDSKRETEGKSKQVLDEFLAKLKNRRKKQIKQKETEGNGRKVGTGFG